MLLNSHFFDYNFVSNQNFQKLKIIKNVRYKIERRKI